MQFILSSQSPYRKSQLQNFGLRFTAHPPQVNEEELKAQGPKDLIELTRFLAFHKAESLRARYPAAIILGSDQIAECAGERLDKPGNRARALEQLQKLSGRAQPRCRAHVYGHRRDSLARAQSERNRSLPRPRSALGLRRILQDRKSRIESY